MKYLLAVAVVLLVIPSISYAAVITTVEWESKPGSPWSYSGTVVDCAVTPSPSGGCALQMTIAAGTYASSTGGGRSEYQLPVSQTDVYIGAWHRYSSNFVGHPNGWKMNFFTLTPGSGICRNVSFGRYGGTFSVVPQICWTDGSVAYRNDANISAWDFNAHRNEWHWIETHTKVNTPGVANGIFEIWIDDVLHLQYLNGKFRDAGDNGLIGIIQQDDTYGGGGSTIVSTMYHWIDHTVVSTTRIGVPGGVQVPTDTTPPTAPSSLVAQ